MQLNTISTLATVLACVCMQTIFVGSLKAESSERQAVQPVELGHVRWNRDLNRAYAESATSGKPVFLLFQEVPGCSGVQAFGKSVLSHGPMVQEIENLFIPVLVYNNRGGKDGELLRKFGEPSWNYQVVRFLNSRGEDLIPRKDGVTTVRQLADRMALALEAAGQPVTQSLQQLAGRTVYKEMAFAQSCFWTGERVLGAVEGVAKTEAGFLEGREVTRVWYDPSQVSEQELVRQARQKGVASAVYGSGEVCPESGLRNACSAFDPQKYSRAPESDQKKQLQGTVFEGFELSDIQATKINAFARSNPKKAAEYLSLSQKEILTSTGR